MYLLNTRTGRRKQRSCKNIPILSLTVNFSAASTEGRGNPSSEKTMGKGTFVIPTWM
jgi:hypothetical protein